MNLLDFCHWLASTPWSIALHESLYAYPLIESTHVMMVALFVGTLWVVDLRLLGAVFADTSIPTVVRRVMPFSLVGFAVMTITGLLLFYAIPVRTYQSVWFRLKVLLLIVAAINAWRFHRRLRADAPRWEGMTRPPLAVRMAGGLSLATWAGVVVAGRLIAYNWFDCDRLQTEWVIWLAGCSGAQE